MGAIEHVHRDPHVETEYEHNFANEYVACINNEEKEDDLVDCSSSTIIRNRWGYEQSLNTIDFNNITKYTNGNEYVYTPVVDRDQFDFFNALDEWKEITEHDAGGSDEENRQDVGWPETEEWKKLERRYGIIRPHSLSYFILWQKLQTTIHLILGMVIL